MAGSYNHITNKKGKFIGTGFLDHLGDAYEALEELYGMVWFLADGDAKSVERARQAYRVGLEISPGVKVTND